MYQNPYLTNYNNQANIDRINVQMAELEKMKQQLQQPPQQQMTPNINQTFQLAPTHQSGIRYANTIDDVGKEIVYVDMPFFSKDMSVVWIKNNKGDIKTYELNEIMPKDEKDIKIDFLMAQIEELKKGMVKNESNANVDDAITEPVKDKVTADVSTISKSTKKSK